MNPRSLALILMLASLAGCATLEPQTPPEVSADPIAIDLAANCTPVKPSPLKDGDGIGGTGCPAG